MDSQGGLNIKQIGEVHNISSKLLVFVMRRESTTTAELECITLQGI